MRWAEVNTELALIVEEAEKYGMPRHVVEAIKYRVARVKDFLRVGEESKLYCDKCHSAAHLFASEGEWLCIKCHPDATPINSGKCNKCGEEEGWVPSPPGNPYSPQPPNARGVGDPLTESITEAIAPSGSGQILTCKNGCHLDDAHKRWLGIG